MGTYPFPTPPPILSHPHPQTDKGYTGDRCHSEGSERNRKEVRDRRTEDPGPAQVGGGRVKGANPVDTDTL